MSFSRESLEKKGPHSVEKEGPRRSSWAKKRLGAQNQVEGQHREDQQLAGW